MIEVDERKVKDWTVRLLENSFGLINYNASRSEFEGQYSKAGIHPNCSHNTDGTDASDPETWDRPRHEVSLFCGGEFRCARCRRLVGWCFGCAGNDGCDGLCDDCTVEIWKKVIH